MTIELTIQSRGKIAGANFPVTINLEDGATLRSLKEGIAYLVPKLPIVRQRLTTEDKRPLVGDDKALRDLGVEKSCTLLVKDLGPQVSWRTVFVVEYLGPMIIHPLLFLIMPAFWEYMGTPFTISPVQLAVFWMVMTHFAKREFESVFVHRFSNATMPLFNIFKNSAHYWLLSGVLLAVSVYSPSLSWESLEGTFQNRPTFLVPCIALWVAAELGNFQSHIILMNLRPAGTRVRRIPYGGAFTLVSCPNYFYETVAWLAICIMTLAIGPFVFLVVSCVQMTLWAIKKHKAYKREFGDQYPRNRKIMFPYIF